MARAGRDRRLPLTGAGREATARHSPGAHCGIAAFIGRGALWLLGFPRARATKVRGVVLAFAGKTEPPKQPTCAAHGDQERSSAHECPIMTFHLFSLAERQVRPQRQVCSLTTLVAHREPATG